MTRAARRTVPRCSPAFLRVNGELRKINADADRGVGGEDVADSGCGRARSSSSATRRSRRASPIAAPTSTRARRSTSRPTSASTSRSPRTCRSLAANAGTVLNASWLGIYGNCVIIDHGMGVQSLYGAPDVVRRQGRRQGHARPAGRPQRLDRPRRRRSPAFHAARRRPDGEPGRMVGPALDADRVERKLREAQEAR